MLITREWKKKARYFIGVRASGRVDWCWAVRNIWEDAFWQGAYLPRHGEATAMSTTLGEKNKEGTSNSFYVSLSAWKLLFSRILLSPPSTIASASTSDY